MTDAFIVQPHVKVDSQRWVVAVVNVPFSAPSGEVHNRPARKRTRAVPDVASAGNMVHLPELGPAS